MENNDELNKQNTEKSRQVLLQKLIAIEAQAHQMYESFLNTTTKQMCINEHHVNKIFDTKVPLIDSEPETLSSMINDINKAIADESENMKLSKEEMNSFFEGIKAELSKPDIDAFKIKVHEYIIHKVLTPAISMVIHSTTGKNRIIECLGYLKEAGKF